MNLNNDSVQSLAYFGCINHAAVALNVLSRFCLLLPHFNVLKFFSPINVSTSVVQVPPARSHTAGRAHPHATVVRRLRQRARHRS